jgi:hypothetical protein
MCPDTHTSFLTHRSDGNEVKAGTTTGGGIGYILINHGAEGSEEWRRRMERARFLGFRFPRFDSERGGNHLGMGGG